MIHSYSDYLFFDDKVLQAIICYRNHYSNTCSHLDGIFSCCIGYFVPEDAFAFEWVIFVNRYEPVEYVFAKDLGKIVPAAYIV